MKIINTGKLDLLPIDIDRLRNEARLLIEKYPFDKKTNQISLKHRKSIEPTFYDGVGSLANFTDGTMYADEKDFTIYHHELANTYLMEVCRQVELATYLGIGRVRLMRLLPRRCSSLHADENIRFHIPIFTNPQALFCFVDEAPIHLPSTNRVYWTNTLKNHFIMNGSLTEERVHLVFSTHAPNRFTYYCFLRDYRAFIRSEDVFDDKSIFYKEISNKIGSRWRS